MSLIYKQAFKTFAVSSLTPTQPDYSTLTRELMLPLILFLTSFVLCNIFKVINLCAIIGSAFWNTQVLHVSRITNIFSFHSTHYKHYRDFRINICKLHNTTYGPKIKSKLSPQIWLWFFQPIPMKQRMSMDFPDCSTTSKMTSGRHHHLFKFRVSVLIYHELLSKQTY